MGARAGAHLGRQARRPGFALIDPQDR